MRPQAVGELVDTLDRLVAPLAHHVCSPELFRQRGPTGVAAQDDDSLRTESARSDHSA